MGFEAGHGRGGSDWDPAPQPKLATGNWTFGLVSSDSLVDLAELRRLCLDGERA
jgi:hypothetical protein